MLKRLLPPLCPRKGYPEGKSLLSSLITEKRATDRVLTREVNTGLVCGRRAEEAPGTNSPGELFAVCVLRFI